MLGPSTSPPKCFSNHPGGQGFNLHRWRCRQLRWHGQLHVPRARAWEGPAGVCGGVGVGVLGSSKNVGAVIFFGKKCEQIIGPDNPTC